MRGLLLQAASDTEPNKNNALPAVPILAERVQGAFIPCEAREAARCTATSQMGRTPQRRLPALGTSPRAAFCSPVALTFCSPVARGRGAALADFSSTRAAFCSRV